MQIKLISENKLTEEQEEQVFTLPIVLWKHWRLQRLQESAIFREFIPFGNG
jgi:hypothetical protein